MNYLHIADMFLVRVHHALFVKHVERHEPHPHIIQAEIFAYFPYELKNVLPCRTRYPNCPTSEKHELS